ncbi:MAG: FAD-dependent oxidoreductase [Planctomycetes bacterium]|nr:FAD-dependent oxidoreductase [Planctomycetota bacterium]
MTIPSTLTPAAAAGRTWDALVIGAGPAGALAARQLALTGAETLLVDRAEFPRPKVCGGCLNGHALRVLHAVGLERLVGQLGSRPLRRFEVYSAGRRAGLTLPDGTAVSRARLDAALVQEAIAAGAAFLPGANGIVLPRAECPQGRRVVELTSAHGRHTTVVYSRIVLAAGGLGHSRSLPAGEFRSHVAHKSRIGVGAVLAEPHGYEPGTIHMAVQRQGYVGLVCLEGAALNVAAAFDAEFVKRSHGPAAAVAELLREAGLPSIPDLSSAAWAGTLPLTRHTRPLAGNRVFLLGDAAGYVEPFTGEGIAWALTAALAVVPLAREGIVAWDRHLARRWMAEYRRRLSGRQRVCRLIAAGVRRPRMASSLLGALSSVPVLARPLIERINGSPARLQGCGS